MSSFSDDYPLLGQENQQTNVDVWRREDLHPNLSGSEILTSKEQAALFQLLGMFEDVDPSAIITVIRGTKGNMEEAIDKLLEMSTTTSLSSSTSSSRLLEPEEFPMLPTQEPLAESQLTNSKMDDFSFKSSMSDVPTDFEDSNMGNSQINQDYSFVVENPLYSFDSQVFEIDDDFEHVDSKSSGSEKTDPEQGWSDQLSWASEQSDQGFELDSQVQCDSYEETSALNPFETQFEFQPTLVVPLPPVIEDSLLDSKSNINESINADVETNDQSQVPLEDVDLETFLEKKKRKKEKKRQKKEVKKMEKKLERLQLRRAFSTDLGVSSDTVHPLPDVIPKELHDQQIAQLEHEKEKVEEEKRVAMLWCLQQITNAKEENEDKEKVIQEQRQEIERLQQLLKQHEDKENKLQRLLVSSKEVIMDGAQALQRNISEGISKMEKEFKAEKEWDVLDQMKDFVNELKQEVASLFRRKNSKENVEEEKENVPSDVQEEKETVPANVEEDEDEEERQLKLAQQASLASFEEETRQREREDEAVENVRRLSLSEGSF